MSHLPSDITVLRTIRENRRFGCYEVEYKGTRAFAKTGSPEGILGEIQGIGQFTELSRMTDLPFRIPKLLYWGHDFVVTEWVEGRPLGSTLTAADVSQLVRSYVAIDQATVNKNQQPSRFTSGTTIRRLRGELRGIPEHPYIDLGLVHKALEYVIGGLPSLEARLTHADLTPNNLLVRGEGVLRKYTLVDYESVSQLWPRFYDVINCGYNRVITGDEALVRQMRDMIARFFERIDEPIEKHLVAVNTICMIRAVSFVVEILGAGQSRSNTQEKMTEELGQRLMRSIDLALEGRLAFS